MLALKIIGIFFGVLILYLVIIIFFPIMNVKKQPIENRKIDKSVPKCRETISFTVDGLKISGWFYKTDKSSCAPCIIMNHGFAGTKDMGLPQYAIKFTQNGYNVLTYDYRFFGSSQGEPRQLYGGLYQIADIKGAIQYVKQRDDVDSNKLIIWGTSAGASYGINIADEDKSIAAVIAQCGAYDSKEDNQIYYDQVGFGFFLWLFVHAQRDKGRSRFNLPPHRYPAYGRENTVAMFTLKGAFEGISRLAETSETFVNETCARMAFLPHPKQPIEAAENVECPVLILVCKQDNLVSPKSHIRLAQVLGKKCKVIEYDIGHFDIYFDEHFEKTTDDTIEFLNEVIK